VPVTSILSTQWFSGPAGPRLAPPWDAAGPVGPVSLRVVKITMVSVVVESTERALSEVRQGSVQGLLDTVTDRNGGEDLVVNRDLMTMNKPSANWGQIIGYYWFNPYYMQLLAIIAIIGYYWLLFFCKKSFLIIGFYCDKLQH
jgi:hypothetical protein